MQVTDRNSEQVLRGVQRLRSMASCNSDFPTSLSLAMGANRTSETHPASLASTALAHLMNSKPSALELLPLRPSPISNNYSPSCKSQPVNSHNSDLKLWRPSDEQFVTNNISSPRGLLRGPNQLDINHMPSSSESEDILDAGDRAPILELSTCIPGHKRNRDPDKLVHADVERGFNEVSSRVSDEDEAGSGTRKKLRLSKEQSALLEESFKKHSTLNPKQKSALAKQLNLRPRQIEVWFQNRRARTKLKKTEVDCELLKRCCESLNEENRRLQKEVAELRALKVGAPCVISHDFYKPLPATTLTMCPSCERLAPHSSAIVAAAAAASSSATASSTTTTTTASANNLPFQKPHMSLTVSPQQQSSAAC